MHVQNIIFFGKTFNAHAFSIVSRTIQMINHNTSARWQKYKIYQTVVDLNSVELLQISHESVSSHPSIIKKISIYLNVSDHLLCRADTQKKKFAIHNKGIRFIHVLLLKPACIGLVSL
jgi:hypothetical protein